MSDFDVDLFVIGGGSGGVRAARIAAQHGARVMLAEEYRLGGTCVIRGCVPKKLLVYAARFHGEFEDAAGFGWTVPHATFDWATLIANKDKEIARLEAAYGALLAKSGVKVVKNRATLADAHTVQVAGGERVKAAHVLISTGGAPSFGDKIPGLEHAISSNEAFHLPELPRRVVIQGGGYIAVEFAGIFAGLGSHVTLIYRGEYILRGFDDEVRQHVRMDMEKHGIKVIEDCAHAHGGMWRGKGAGSIGDIGIYSFQLHKVITAGEGGAVITNAAAGLANVKALVYVDASAPAPGETNGQLSGAASILTKDTPAQLFFTTSYPGAPAGASELYLNENIFIRYFANDLPRAEAEQLWASQRGASTAAFNTPSKFAAWKTIPSWYFISTNDQIITAASELAMAHRAHSHITLFRGGSHLTLISHPNAVTAVIASAVCSLR